MAIEFESSMQNLVYQVDAGSGRKVIQTVLFALFAFAMAALYTFANFQGLKDPRAMEEAQVARNLATQGRWTTQCVRPLSMGLLAEVQIRTYHESQDKRIYSIRETWDSPGA